VIQKLHEIYTFLVGTPEIQGRVGTRTTNVRIKVEAEIEFTIVDAALSRRSDGMDVFPRLVAGYDSGAAGKGGAGGIHGFWRGCRVLLRFLFGGIRITLNSRNLRLLRGNGVHRFSVWQANSYFRRAQ
jgi:hypothetical protein